MSDSWAAFRDGARRVHAAPAILLGAWALTMAAAIQVALTRSPGDLRGAANTIVWLAAGWIVDIVAQPTDAFLEMKLRFGWSVSTLLAIVWIALLAWLFLTGGIIDRYARDRPTRAFGFFGVSGVFLPRFLRLAAIQIVVDAALFLAIRPLVVALAALALWGLVVDYARVRAVVEDRRSAVGALAGAVAFLRRNVVAAGALFALDYAAFLTVTWTLQAAAEAATGSPMFELPLWTRAAWTSLAVGALFWVRLLFWASETALFQMKLAHAGYVARPEPQWPESPEVEAISG